MSNIHELEDYLDYCDSLSVEHLKLYQDILAQADWWYEYTDNSKKYIKGKQQVARLRLFSEYSDKHKELFDLWQDYSKNPKHNKKPELEDVI